MTELKLSSLTPEAKVAYVEHQIFKVQRGDLDSIECPYCGLSFVAGTPTLCCALMGEAVAAVLFKIETTDQLNQVARIAEGADKQVSLAIN